jgi:hypothetical protein
MWSGGLTVQRQHLHLLLLPLHIGKSRIFHHQEVLWSSKTCNLGTLGNPSVVADTLVQVKATPSARIHMARKLRGLDLRSNRSHSNNLLLQLSDILICSGLKIQFRNFLGKVGICRIITTRVLFLVQLHSSQDNKQMSINCQVSAHQLMNLDPLDLDAIRAFSRRLEADSHVHLPGSGITQHLEMEHCRLPQDLLKLVTNMPSQKLLLKEL